MGGVSGTMLLQLCGIMCTCYFVVCGLCNGVEF